MNIQPVEKQVVNPFKLEVIEVFDTIQGEGPFAGTPAVFVRLAGCSLMCPQCDTQYTQGRETHDPDNLVKMVLDIRKRGLCVITGGEPFRQDFSLFVRNLVDDSCGDMDIQIETNGVNYPADDSRWNTIWPWMTIVCSPKTPKINPFMMDKIDYLKYVVKAGEVDEKDGLPLHSLGMECGVAKPWGDFLTYPQKVFISPMDEGNEEANARNREVAVTSCLKFGYRLSLQTHKLLNLR